MSCQGNRPPRRARVWLATFAVVALGALGFVPSALAVPANFWGVVPQTPPSVEQLQRLKAGGVDSMRVPISWSSVQPVRGGAWDWSDADTLIGVAAAARLNVLPFLSSAPSWAVPTDRRFGSSAFLPVRSGKQRSGWKRFVTEAILRYGPRGTFWSENPSLPRKPIRIWQIWNEPNFKYFVGRPDPAEYGKLVTLSSAAIKSVDPGAQVILGGLQPRSVRVDGPGGEAGQEQDGGDPAVDTAGELGDVAIERRPAIRREHRDPDGRAVHGRPREYTAPRRLRAGSSPSGDVVRPCRPWRPAW